MDGIPMPGGWTMAALWLPICGRSWFGAAAGFVGMWAAMMVPMMLPLAVAPLRRYRSALDGSGRAFLLTVAAGLAWAATWTAAGLPVYVAGTAVAQAMLGMPALARLAPALAALAGVAGVLWHVASWPRRSPHRAPPGPPACAAALLQGARLGGHCVRRCAGLTMALLAAGIMERGTMLCAFALVAVESVCLRDG